jgi:aminoglycoside phosphotransferase (APT) family kinase protein
MSHLPPPAAALRRAATLAGPGATVQRTEALAGGTHARTFLVQTTGPGLDVVLREFPPGDDTARREARVLTALDGLGGLAPRLLACDLDGGSWVLISRLPGTADITPASPGAAAEQLGRILARIHATPRPQVAGLPELFDRVTSSPADLSGPAAAAVAAGWKRLASAPSVLTHRDFWSGNVVWRDGQLTGVVDWPGAALGPAGVDVSWCRLDLFLLHGERAADTFTAAYEAAAGAILPGRRLWDLWAAAQSHAYVDTWMPNYRDLGRTDLTAAELRRRHAAWTARRLAAAPDPDAEAAGGQVPGAEAEGGAGQGSQDHLAR